MERKKYEQPDEESIIYAVQEEPIVFSKAISDLFLKDNDPADLMALYWFYYYIAKWQHTNQPWATDTFCMSGLKWGHTRFYKAKAKLLKFGLIEKICNKTKDGKITKWYIKVRFIWKNETINQNAQNVIVEAKNQNAQNPHVDNERTNALSSNSINALNSNNLCNRQGKKIKEERNKDYLQYSQKLSEIIRTNKNYKHTTSQIKSWSNDFRRLVEENDVAVERIEKALNWYEKNISGEYTPVIESGRSFRDKFTRLEAAMKKAPHKNYQPEPSIIENGITFTLNRKWLYVNKEKGFAEFQLTKDQILSAIGNRPKCMYQDNIRYDICPDGRYRHPESGDLYIP
jgi:hypothetical protein